MIESDETSAKSFRFVMAEALMARNPGNLPA
jgi:hypothetical protein